MFKESSKSSGVFRTQPSIHDGDFLWIYLTAYYFCNRSSIIDTQLGYILASKNFEFFKVKLIWSKSSRLLQRIAFSCFSWDSINIIIKKQNHWLSCLISCQKWLKSIYSRSRKKSLSQSLQIQWIIFGNDKFSVFQEDLISQVTRIIFHK